MIPPSSDSPHRAEWDLLHELREHAQLLQLVTEAQGNELQLQTKLRREHPDRLVRAAFALCELRKKGGAKFSRADRMWFDRQGYEQATAEPVARYKAERFEGHVWDFCCGVGGDCIALARHADVTAVDINPAACLRTEWNAAVYDVASRVTTVCSDVEKLDARDGLVLIDPDRRQKGAGRAVRIEDYVPGLQFLQRLTTGFRGGAIKLSPACNFGGKFPEAEVELISLRGECKEATIWFGDLRSDAPWRATLLPTGETLAGNPLDFFVDQSPPLGFIFDPDPAVVRAGLVDAAAQRLSLSRLDREEEYLTGPVAVESPFVQGFEILADLPNSMSEVRSYFRTSQAGQVEIKCRHIPIEAETIRRRLPLPGDQPLVVIFARVAGKSRALVCRRTTH
jgi:THUMP domain-like/RNA cap guanine-N2 methyltransferase